MFHPLSFGEGAGGEVEQPGVAGKCLRNMIFNMRLVQRFGNTYTYPCQGFEPWQGWISHEMSPYFRNRVLVVLHEGEHW